jgi:hypothetical protein
MTAWRFAGGGKREPGQGGAGARGGEGEKKLATVHGGAP